MAHFASGKIQGPAGFRRTLRALAVWAALMPAAMAQQIDAPEPGTGIISGTVTDADQDIIPGATVTLDGPATSRTLAADENGGFSFSDVAPGGPYVVTINGNGLVPWTSPALTLKPGEVAFVSGVKVRFSGDVTSVTVNASSEEIAIQQVQLEEKQRLFGIVPNFYVVYDPNPVPLTTKLKFSLALRAETDPVVFVGGAMLSAMDQAANLHDYGQGASAYAKRFGANYATAFSNVMIGGAVLPSLLHQDPRYFYQGTGTKRSRLLHALSSPFICRGDNGQRQVNFSSIGGDLAAGAIAESYYPRSNRGPGLVFQSTLITTTGRMANAVIQEFLLRRFTPGASHHQ